MAKPSTPIALTGVLTLFSCEICEDNGLREYAVSCVNGDVLELCNSCLDMELQTEDIALFARFPGLAPLQKASV
jgi:hypothetical protein